MSQRLDLPTLIDRYHDEDSCRSMLEGLRWPSGPVCPGCDESERIGRVSTRPLLRCNACGRQFSVTVGTVMQDSKLPLWKWFLATYLICESKKGYSSNQLKRTLGVSYKTAWFLTHRIRGAMGQLEHYKLTGVVEVDETFHGGAPRYKQRDARGKVKRGMIPGRKAVVLGALERGGQVRLRLADNRGTIEIGAFLSANVDDAAPYVFTDEFRTYKGLLGDEDTQHETVNHREDEWVRGQVHTNTIEGVWSLFKRSVIGTHHHMSVKHLQSYLDEIAFKYNNRDNLDIFRETLRVLVTADPLTYAALTGD